MSYNILVTGNFNFVEIVANVLLFDGFPKPGFENNNACFDLSVFCISDLWILLSSQLDLTLRTDRSVWPSIIY